MQTLGCKQFIWLINATKFSLLIIFNTEMKKLNFYKNFIRNHDEDSGKGYILEFNVKYPKELHKLHNDMPFLPHKNKK